MRFRWMAGAVLVAAAMGIAAGEADAQACGDLTGVPEDVYTLYVDQLDELPLLGPDACAKLTQGGVAACHKAVASAVRCYQSLYRSTFKAQKIACGATPEPAQCSADYKSALDGVLDLIDGIAEPVHAECDGIFASELYFACLAI